MGARMWCRVGVVTAIALVSCSGDDEPPAASMSDAAELAEMLAATPLGCEDAVPVDPLGDHPADGVDYPLPSAVRCATAVGPAFLLVYGHADDRAAARTNGEVQSAVGMCPAGAVEVGSVVADNWRVVVQDADDAATVASALGEGEPEALSCV